MARTRQSLNNKRKAKDDIDNDRPAHHIKTERPALEAKAKLTKIAGVDLANTNDNSYSAAKTLNNIKDWFDRRNNIKTKEAELSTILTDTARLVVRYSVRNFSAMLKAQSREARLGLAGLATVRLPRRHKQSTMTCTELYPWAEDLASTMATLFDCGTDQARGENKMLGFEFYGLVVNAVAAAMAFQFSFNLIMSWTRKAEADVKDFRCGIYVSKLRAGVERARGKQPGVSNGEGVVEGR